MKLHQNVLKFTGLHYGVVYYDPEVELGPVPILPLTLDLSPNPRSCVFL